jgi:hypothetical protein
MSISIRLRKAGSGSLLGQNESGPERVLAIGFGSGVATRRRSFPDLQRTGSSTSDRLVGF